MKKLDLKELCESMDNDMVIAEKVNELVDHINTDYCYKTKYDPRVQIVGWGKSEDEIPTGKFTPAIKLSNISKEDFEPVELPKEECIHKGWKCTCEPKETSLRDGEMPCLKCARKHHDNWQCEYNMTYKRYLLGELALVELALKSKNT